MKQIESFVPNAQELKKRKINPFILESEIGRGINEGFTEWYRRNVFENKDEATYEIIGNDHNKTIYNMMREDPVIANGTFSNYYLYNSTNKKLKSYGYTEEMPLLLQTRLLEIMDLVKKSTSVDQLMNLMKQEFPQRVSEFQLVESYINGLVNMDDKSTVRDYTKQVYAQIDASSLDVSAVSRLKTMIAIAENSKFLWVETK